MRINPLRARSLYASYTHHLNGSPIYRGACRLDQLMTAPDAQRNSEWCKLVHPESDLVCTIDSMHHSLQGAQDAITQHPPLHCNLHGHITGKAVRCVQTGITYDNASQAASANNISAGAMSNHLNGRDGYATVRNLSFERV